MTHPHGGRRSRWTFLLVEMALIIASILVAFALDAWWDERGARADERAQLEALRDELVESRAALDEVIASVEEHGRNVDELVALLLQAEGAAVEVPNALLGSAVSWRTSDVWISTLESMRAAGSLRLLGDAGLRNALAAFPGTLEDVQEDEAVGRDFVEQVLGPALARHGLAKAAYDNRLGRDPAYMSGQTRFVPNGEIIGLLAARQVHIGFSKEGLPRIGETMDALVERIDAQLR